MQRALDIAEKFREIQAKGCELIEKADGGAIFSEDYWEKKIGKGITRVIQQGKHVEKGAINFSLVSGHLSERMMKVIGKQGNHFVATGLSSIIHPVNPWSPIIHMNTRFFELETGECWFGGGIDLTPHYIDPLEAKFFHEKLKELCESINGDIYPGFKQHADDYFYLSHRGETRGVGGIFYDYLQPSKSHLFNDLVKFSVDLGKLYPELYIQLLDNKKNMHYTTREKQWQQLRRGRYVEFNLVYDRGTKFGLESEGNIESILVSMPPGASWEYNFTPEPGSKEQNTLDMLKKNIDWINYK